MASPLGPSTTIAAGVAALAALLAGPARAQNEPLRPPVLVVEDLLGDDWKAAQAARDEAARIGARVVPSLIRARQSAPPVAEAREPIDEIIRAVVEVLAAEVERPLTAALRRITADAALGGIVGASNRDLPDLSVPELSLEELGDAGSISADEPVRRIDKLERARRARGALVLLGPAVTRFMLVVPPVRDLETARLLARLAAEVYELERALALAAETASARETFRARYAGLADLATPIIAAGIRDDEPRVRALFQQVRDEALEAGLAALDDPSPGRRRFAEEALYRLGQLARPSLLAIAAGDDPEHGSAHAVESAARLARRIRFGLGRALIRKIGHDFAGYDELPFRERRALVFEVERLGGVDAVPTLRALLDEERSDEVRSVAAIGLFRQHDPLGARWLEVHQQGIPLVRLSKRELAAIFMKQGIEYLTLRRFERAEREFNQVLELEPDNEVAWYNLACTYSLWGKIDEAIEHLERAVEAGFDDTTHIEKDTDLDNIRDDPRYARIIAGIEASRSRQ